MCTCSQIFIWNFTIKYLTIRELDIIAVSLLSNLSKIIKLKEVKK